MELMKIETNESGEQLVSGRELHGFMEVGTHYKDWFPRMCEYGFTENIDYTSIAQKRATAQGNETTFTDHVLKLDMAKEISMLARTEKGKQARQYFIQIEKAWNTPEMIMARAMQLSNSRLITYETKIKSLEIMIEQNKPLVRFAEALDVSTNSILIGQLAKLIKQNGVDIGQNRLFERLRDEGYLCQKGENYNMPTQKSMDLKVFEVKTTTINNPDGSVRVTKTTKVTGKGQMYFVNKLLPKQG